MTRKKKTLQLYLTKLHSCDVLLALLKPYYKSQIMRVVAVLIYLEYNVFVRVAA